MRPYSSLIRTSLAAASLCAAWLPGTPANAQMDMDLMMKWADARVIHWSVVGDYEGEELILNVGTSGYAPVKDHVEIGFDYTNEGNGGLVGTPKFVDSPTQMGALRNGAAGCRAPSVSGKYEHSTIESIEDGLGGQLAMMVRTDYPAGAVPVSCTGGNQSSPARSSIDRIDLFVPSVMMLAMGDELSNSDPNMSVSKDKKSLIVKRDGWTYTYTPTKVK